MDNTQAPAKLDVLGRYNAERARGIVHTEQWHRAMAELQVEYNNELLAESEQRQRLKAVANG